ETEACLHALAVGGDHALWVVGDEGVVARVIDDRFERVHVESEIRFAAVVAVRDEMILLGSDGAGRRWLAGRVTVVQATGTTRGLNALALTKAGTWILAGDGGYIARSPDGAWWSRVACGVDADLEAVATLDDGRIIVVGDRGSVLVSADDGRSWQA